MKTIEQVLNNYKEFSNSLVGDRFGRRFIEFLTEEQAASISWYVKDGYDWPEPKEWTEENVLEQLKLDVEFGWENACNKYWNSAGLMYDVCQAWCKVLENGLEDFDEYGWYGKPLFKAIAHKYNWELPNEYPDGTELNFADCMDELGIEVN